MSQSDFIRALTEELRAWQDETLYLTELDVAAMLARAVARTLGLEFEDETEPKEDEYVSTDQGR